MITQARCDDYNSNAIEHTKRQKFESKVNFAFLTKGMLSK